MLRLSNITGFGGRGVAVGTGSISFLSLEEDASDESTYSFSTSLGSAVATRRIIVGVGIRKAGAEPAITAVSIHGIAATRVIGVRNTLSGDTDEIALYVAAVPTGSSGTLEVTLSGPAQRCACGVWRLIEATSATPYAAASDINAGPLTLGLPVPENGCVVAMCSGVNATDGVAWTGLTENFDEPPEGTQRFSGASIKLATAASLAITAAFTPSSTHEAGVSAVWV